MPKLRVLDFETTGFSPKGEANTHQVIEAAYHDILKKEDSTILTPGVEKRYKPTRDIDIAAMAVHHIRMQDLETASEQELLVPFLTRGEPDIYAAHNAEFEQDFFNPDSSWWICTFKCAKHVWADAPSYSNQGLRYFLNLDDTEGFDRSRSLPAHAAMPDTYITALILLKLLEEHSIKQLITWTREPTIHRVVPMGKFKGKPWSACDMGYLGWILGQRDMDDDIKHAARQEMSRR